MTVEMVLKTLKLNGANATKLILAVVPEIAKQDWTKTRQELKVKNRERIHSMCTEVATLYSSYCLILPGFSKFHEH